MSFLIETGRFMAKAAVNPVTYREIGVFVADWVHSKSPLYALGKLPVEERWIEAEKSLSPKQRELFIEKEVSALAQKPAVAINRETIEASDLPKPVKDFLLNPPKDEYFKWGEEGMAKINAYGNGRGSAAPHSAYEAQVGLYDRVCCHAIVVDCRMVTPIYESVAKDDPLVGYEKALGKFVQERGEFGVMGELVRFVMEAYQSHDAVERLLLSCREKQGQEGKSVFLKSPFQGSHTRLQVRDGHDVDLSYASPQNVACVVEFMTSTGENVSLIDQVKKNKMIPFSVNHVGLGRRTNPDIQKNLVIVFGNRTAKLVEEKIEGASVTSAPVQLLELLTRKVSDAKVIPGD